MSLLLAQTMQAAAAEAYPIFSGRVTSSGALISDSNSGGFSSSRIATGHYRVDFNTTILDALVIVTADSTSDNFTRSTQMPVRTDTHFTVETKQNQGNRVDSGFSFIVFPSFIVPPANLPYYRVKVDSSGVAIEAPVGWVTSKPASGQYLIEFNETIPDAVGAFTAISDWGGTLSTAVLERSETAIRLRLGQWALNSPALDYPLDIIIVPTSNTPTKPLLGAAQIGANGAPDFITSGFSYNLDSGAFACDLVNGNAGTALRAINGNSATVAFSANLGGRVASAAEGFVSLRDYNNTNVAFVTHNLIFTYE